MKKAAFFFILLIILLSTIILPIQSVYADDNDCTNINDASDKSRCLNDLIAKYQKQLDDARGQEKTLKSQLTFIDTQAKVTELKISEAENQIAKLDHEINDLATRITRLSATVDELSQVLLTRIVQTYKYGNYSAIDLFFSSNGFADLLEKVKYMSVAQANDKKVLYQLQATKTTYNDQKVDKQTRQAQQEKLKKDLKVYQAQLDDQKKQKDNLLKITQNNEAKYQILLAQARAEYLAIQGIIAGRGKESEIGLITQGQKIANIIDGPSCNSSGAHLHFTVVQNKNSLNPFNYLKSIDYRNCSGASCGSGSGDPFNPSGEWDWPLNSPITMNQGYGNTWSINNTWVGNIYSFHNGIDIVSSSLEVKAVKTGILFRGSYNGAGGCALPYVRVKHNEGELETLYLHVL